MSLFAEKVNEIEQAYEVLGHQLGSGFLSTPASTLSENAGILFAGLNPDGANFEAPMSSVQAENAYRVKRWGSHGQLSDIQVQVRMMDEMLSEKLQQPYHPYG
jgi:hypothetical protein